MTDRSRGGPLAAIGMFSVLPVPDSYRAPSPRAVLWLPLVGVIVAALAYIPALAVWRGGGHGSALLAAVLIVSCHALLTRGLHLDGLADVADGLGSGRPAGEARAIMKRSDIGPFGVAALTCVLLIQVAAVSTVLGAGSIGEGFVAVLIAVATGRVAVVNATGDRLAPGSAFGGLVAGTVGRPARLAIGGFLLLTAVAVSATLDASPANLGWATAGVLAGLGLASVARRHAVRRLGGISGDVFGALNELATTFTLLVLAAGSVWHR